MKLSRVARLCMMTLAYVARTAFGAVPLLSRRWVPKPPTPHRVPWRLAVRFNVLILARAASGRHWSRVNAAKRLTGELLAHARRNLPRQEIRPLPTLQREDPLFEQRFGELFGAHRPFVVRGWKLGQFDVDFDQVLRQSAKVRVLFTDARGRHFMAPLRYLLDDPTAYVTNCERLLIENPDLTCLESRATLERLTGARPSFAQLFMGNRVGTGTPFHCANNSNFFFMLDGAKRWTFVHPNDTPLMYPTFKPLFGASAVHAMRDITHYPLFEYAPRFEVELKRGDLLFNPNWWWHCVNNLTPRTLGLATRWVRPGYMSAVNGCMPSLLQLTSPGFLGPIIRRYLSHGTLTTANDGEPDEPDRLTFFEQHVHTPLDREAYELEVHRLWHDDTVFSTLE